MLRAQGLNQQQQTDFVLGALEGDAKRELQLVNPRDRDTGQKVLDVWKNCMPNQPLKHSYGLASLIADSGPTKV